jgi:hypothetical protein
MTLDTLNALLGAILSLLLSFTTIKTWFDGLSGDAKRLAIIGLLAAISLASYLLACSPLAPELGLALTCDQAGAVAVLRAFLAALVANQAAYALTPRRALRRQAPGA